MFVLYKNEILIDMMVRDSGIIQLIYFVQRCWIDPYTSVLGLWKLMDSVNLGRIKSTVQTTVRQVQDEMQLLLLFTFYIKEFAAA